MRMTTFLLYFCLLFVSGICEKFAKVMYHYGIMFTRVPLELALSSCDWLSADEQRFCSAVVKDGERAKEIFLYCKLRYSTAICLQSLIIINYVG